MNVKTLAVMFVYHRLDFLADVFNIFTTVQYIQNLYENYHLPSFYLIRGQKVLSQRCYNYIVIFIDINFR
jgi:hypothetical protein